MVDDILVIYSEIKSDVDEILVKNIITDKKEKLTVHFYSFFENIELYGVKVEINKISDIENHHPVF